jgi:Na+/proline symporter
VQKVKSTEQADEFVNIETRFNEISARKKVAAFQLTGALDAGDEAQMQTARQELKELHSASAQLRSEAVAVIKSAVPAADTNDTNYIFLNFVLNYLPHGLIGLLIAVVFCASWNSTTAELNALASTTVVDIYRRSINPQASPKHYLQAAKLATLCWGIFAVGVAMLANQLGSLIEAVNILGSLFYGNILGIFLTAFFLKKVKGSAIFIAALITEAIILLMYFVDVIAFLWLNLIGCLMVMLLAALLQKLFPADSDAVVAS